MLNIKKKSYIENPKPLWLQTYQSKRSNHLMSGFPLLGSLYSRMISSRDNADTLERNDVEINWNPVQFSGAGLNR